MSFLNTIIERINNNIKILEKNKEIAFNNNDDKYYLIFKEKLQKEYKKLDFWNTKKNLRIKINKN